MQRMRSYFLLVMGTTGVALLVSLFLNLLVNPFRLTPSALSVEALEPYREISGRMRMGKAGMLRTRSNWQVLLAGSSRINHSLDPADPAWAGRKVINLGLSGGFIYESDAIIRHALAEGADPEIVMIGIDPSDLTSDYDSRKVTDYAVSPLAPTNEPMNREMRYLLGISMMEQSFEVLTRAISRKPARYSPEGFRIPGSQRKRESQLAFIMEELAAGQVDHHQHQIVEKDKVDTLIALISHLQERETRVILLYVPLHSLIHARSEDDGNGVIPFETERRSLCDIAAQTGAEFWDFYDFSSISREPLPTDATGKMKGWDDLAHFTPAIGSHILSRILDTENLSPVGFGTKITPANLDEHLLAVKTSYQLYLEGNGRKDLKLKEERRPE